MKTTGWCVARSGEWAWWVREDALAGGWRVMEYLSGGLMAAITVESREAAEAMCRKKALDRGEIA